MAGPFLPQHHPGPMAMAPGPAPQLYGHPLAAAAPVVAYPGHLMPAAAPAPFQSKLQQRAAKRLRKPNEDVFWQLMRNSKGLRDGAKADLEASFQILYFDQARSPVFVDEVLKRIKRLDSNGEERKFKP